jgi:hypothetical protein
VFEGYETLGPANFPMDPQAVRTPKKEEVSSSQTEASGRLGYCGLRAIAARLGVSRNTVLAWYERWGFLMYSAPHRAAVGLVHERLAHS